MTMMLTTMMTTTVMWVLNTTRQLNGFARRFSPSAKLSADDGQATAEYALVMLAAATLAGLLIAWATSTDAVGRLMDAVVDSLLAEIP